MRHDLIPALAAALLLAACPSATVTSTTTGATGNATSQGNPDRSDTPALPSTPPDQTPTINGLRDTARELIRTQTLAWWQAWTSGTPVDEAPFAARRATLTATDATLRIAEARALLGREPSVEPARLRALELLQRFAEGERVGLGLASIETGADAAVRRTRVKLGEQEYGLDEIESQLAAEPSAAERAALDSAAIAALPPVATFESTRRTRLVSLLAEGTPAEAVVRLAAFHDTTPDDARALATRTLEATGPSYARRLDARARTETGLPADKLRRADLPRLLRPPRVENAFSGKAALDAARSTFKGLGLELDARPGLTLDTTPNPKRQARPATFLVEVPADVRVSYRPGAGEDHQRALLHELATALAATLTRTNRWEFRTFGVAPASLAAAYLFEELVADPLWLSTVAGLPPADANRIADHARFRRLAVVRRLAATVLHTLDSTLGTVDPAPTFRTLATRATGVTWTEAEGARWVLDSDGLLSEYDHLCAHLLAAQLANRFRAAHGQAWWTVPAVGEQLAALWNDGSGTRFDTLSQGLGTTDPDPTALVIDVDR